MFYGLSPGPVCCPALMQAVSVVHQEIASRKIKVLVADDEQIIADTLTLILNKSGFEACAVYSGEAAVHALPRFQPDVLISDIIMNGMTGVDAAIAVLSQYPNCKILLLSGQAATVDLLQSARARGHTFEVLAKPVHPSQILLRLGAMNASLRATAVQPPKLFNSSMRTPLRSRTGSYR